MISKNISVYLRKNRKVPFKEKYVVISASEKKVRIHQKFPDATKNQKIELNFDECKRLMNILSHYAFKGTYTYSKDKAIIYREQD